MAAPIRTYTGIVLRTVKLKETDLIVTVLTDEGFQISCVAHGARRPGSKFGARLEPFGTLKLSLSQRGELGTLREASFITSRSHISGNLIKLAGASALCSAVYQFTYHQTQDRILFELLSAALDLIEVEGSDQTIALVLAASLLKIPSMLGFLPELKHCVLCGEPYLERAWFEPHTGGVICNSCIQTIPGALQYDSILFQWAHTLIFSTFDEIRAYSIPSYVIEKLLDISYAWTRECVGLRLKAVEFFIEQGLIYD